MTRKLIIAAQRLVDDLAELTFAPPTTHVYNPLVYAFDPYARYVRRYGQGHKEALFVGMNPGPFGMAQTGVPFGDIPSVRDYLHIDGDVGHPPTEHEKRPIQGFACPRVEVSGKRVWGAIADHYGPAESFFERFFVDNYCPLVFMEGEGGRNRTPNKLPKTERVPLFAACDAHLRALVDALKPRLVIGIGAFAETRAKEALADIPGVQVGRVLHPSPANPRANKGWADAARRELAALGLCDESLASAQK